MDGTILEIFRMIIAALSVHDKARKVCFFGEIFLLANISIDVALKILLLILSNANVYFTDQKVN